jgi:hypothetical protein
VGQLFGRRCELVVAQPPTVGTFSPNEPNALLIRDLRISFSIEKDDKPQPNRCEIKIYNLAPASRLALENKGVKVILSAGYENNQVGQIFSGSARYVNSQKQGPDWVTTIQCGDGERSFRFAFASQVFQAGTGLGQVVQQLVKTLQVDPGNAPQLATDLTEQFADGYTVHAPAAKELSRLLEPRGYTWSIQDGRFVALQELQVLQEALVLVSQDTGLIGSPEYGTGEKAKGPATLKVSQMLNPAIRPGVKIEVRSRGRNGYFKVKKCRQVGDTFGKDWQTEMEAIPV